MRKKIFLTIENQLSIDDIFWNTLAFQSIYSLSFSLGFYCYTSQLELN